MLICIYDINSCPATIFKRIWHMSQKKDKKADSSGIEKDPTSPKANIKYKLKPIFLQVIGVSMMLLGGFMILFPLFSPEEAYVPKVNFEPKEQTNRIINGINTNRVKAGTIISDRKAENTAAKIQKTGKWLATDYTPGDIGVGNYEVKVGDTLWEISEAVYGNGNKWRKILRRNKSSIGFLPNGSQALIIPGQKLIIAK